MKKLSKKQRNKVYKKVLESEESFVKEWLRKFDGGMCHELLYASNAGTNNSYDALEIFPEFSLFKPQPRKYVWFDYSEGNGGRELILMFCIEMTL